MMMKTCYGLSSLRSGVNVISITNMICLVSQILGRCIYHMKDYLFDTEAELYWRSDAEFDQDHKNVTNTNTNETAMDPWEDHEFMSGFIFTMWTVLMFTTNISLKQSTFIPALHKIYVWLVINYAVLICLLMHLVNYITLFKNTTAQKIIRRIDDPFIGGFIPNIMLTVIFALEIYAIHSHYIEEQNAMKNDVQLKWSHVSKNQVLSQGTAYPSASTLKNTMSRQTQEGLSETRISPFVTNILLNRA